jgi:Mg/Co/Ni transporter MgtE
MQYLLSEEEYERLVPAEQVTEAQLIAIRKSMVIDCMWEVLYDLPEDVREAAIKSLNRKLQTFGHDADVRPETRP